MPVLHKYSQNYDKSGYYVKVNWSAPHPYPLQTPAITEQIYRELGFKPGDKVPNELTSRLFNAGLHWTEGNGTGDPQKQTGIDPITNADLPELDRDQLESVYDLLENIEGKVDGQDVDAGSVRELKSQLESLRSDTASGKSSSEVAPERIAPLIEDLWGQEVTQEQANELRQNAEFPVAFDQSIKQFVRKHPITPRDFTVNDHGDPTFVFRSGSIDWMLADCRPKSLDFDWAVTVAPNTDRRFELRISPKGIVRLVFEERRLTEQQAADLITITPCLVWTLDVLDDYSLNDSWNGASIRNDLPSPHRGWFEEQVRLAVAARNPSDYPEEGIVIDKPDRYFARIRSADRCIICAPVNSLPSSVETGTEVTFETSKRYGSLYATDVTSKNGEGETAGESKTSEKETLEEISSVFDSGVVSSVEDVLNEGTAEILDEWEPVLLSNETEVERDELSSEEKRHLNRSVPQFQFQESKPVYIQVTDDYIEYGLPLEEESDITSLIEIQIIDYHNTDNGPGSVLKRRYEALLNLTVVDESVWMECVYDRYGEFIERSVTPSLSELMAGLAMPDADLIRMEVTEVQDKIRRLDERIGE